MTLGQMQGAVQEGSQHEVPPVQRPGQTSCTSRPGSAWLAGVRQERWLALGQTQQPGLAQVLPGPGPAELSPFLPSPTSPLPSVLPRSKPSQQCWLLRSLEGRQNPPPPAAWLCDPGQLAPLPGPFGL